MDLEGSGRDVIKVLSQNLPGGTGRIHNSRCPDQYLSQAPLECYRYANPFGLN
jgi:hypothetical protein